MNFKFFQRSKPTQSTHPTQPAQNMYLCYHMDEVLIHVLRYKQIHNQEILNYETFFECVNVPINGWMRILNWRNYTNMNPEMIEIDYSVVEINTTPRNYTARMEVNELMRRININGIREL